MTRQPPNDSLPGNVYRFPAPPIEARTSDDPTTQLIEALFSGYRIAVAAYHSAPTSTRWRDLKRSFACWQTAFLAECGGTPK